MGRALSYYADYSPRDEQRFNSMLIVFRGAENKEQLGQLAGMYVFDLSYHREDIVVAIGRVEHERGWR